MRAIEELGVRSPLKEAGLTKNEIRELSKAFKLPSWDKPSYACLASRFPYGTKISQDVLKNIDYAENKIRSYGISQVRVRHHESIVRIEVPEADIERLTQKVLRHEMISFFKKIGYTYITLDLAGYRTGSLNEVLPCD